MAETTIVSEPPARRPYKGSCHCGNIQYIVYLTMPHTPPQTRERGQQAFYRCNCTVCHKSGFLHARVNSSPDDFLLLSPQDPYRDLGDYQCDGGHLHFFYCKNCAVRCFIFMGEGETVEVDDEAVLALVASKEEGSDGGKKKLTAWRAKKEGWQEGKFKHGCYLSVNALTIEPGQAGFDLRDWTEKKWMTYLDVLRSGQEDAGDPTYDRPHPGGSY